MKNAENNNRDQESKSIDSIDAGKKNQYIDSNKVTGGGIKTTDVGGSGKTGAGQA
jgi:hypothetical protein